MASACIAFGSSGPRHLHAFRDISDLVFTGAASLQEQARWFDENGPFVPGLIEHLRTRRRRRTTGFCSGRTATTRPFTACRPYRDRAVLVPTAEEDPLIHAPISRVVLRAAEGLSLPDARRTRSRDRAHRRRHSAVRSHRRRPRGGGRHARRARCSTLWGPQAFLLYMGRIERNKGCETLLRYFDALPGRRPPGDPAGHGGTGHHADSRAPADSAARVRAGCVRDALLAHARALVVPSPYESLSMVLLEAWNHGVPALVNGRCRVLKGQVERADGGLHYGNVRESSAEALELLVREPDLARTLGAQGRAYVDQRVPAGRS